MLIAGQLLLPDPRGHARLTPGQVLIEGERIAKVVVNGSIGRPDLGSEHCIIAPGFIDAHVHLPQFDCIGIDGLTLLDWLHRAVFPTEAKWADADHAAAVVARVARRFLANGTTGIAAYATVHHEATKAAIRVLHTAGLRAIVGQVLMDQQAPAELLRPANQLLKEAESLFAAAAGRVEVAVTPRFAVSCSPELLNGAGALAKRTGAPVQTHLSETIGECAIVRELHGGGGAVTYTDVYAKAGLLTPRTILGHGIYLGADEQRTIHDTGSVVAHCPGANLFLQSGTMDRAGYQRAGLRLALGSDVAGGPDVSMVRVARAMIETAKHRRMHDGVTPIPSPAEAWGQITWGNADALAWADSGRIAAGAWADIVVVDPRIGSNAQSDWRTSIDPLSTLLYGWDERWIASTLVRGGRCIRRSSSMNAWIAPVTLTGRIVRLEPLENRHAPGLLAAAEPALFRFTPQMPAEWSIAGFEKQIDTLNAMPEVTAFAMVLIETDAVIGRTTYMDINAFSRGAEIGRTWIARAHQGTRVNPEVKFLMLRHAFESLSPTAIRVQLCTGGTNLHSQRAIAELGAVKEGVLRNHRIVPDGPDVNAPHIFRDTVVFSIIETEWPTVKRSLIERIGWGA